MDTINSKNLGLRGKNLIPKQHSPQPKNKVKKAPKHKKGELFLQGPIPWNWIAKASQVNGKGSTLKLVMAIWFHSGLSGHSAVIKITRRTLNDLGLERNSVYRAIKTLEKAKLISVLRKKGARPSITILGIDDEIA